MTHRIRLLVPIVFAFFLLSATSSIAPQTATAATLAATTSCSNGVDNAGGLGLICEVTIVNRITATGGSSRVTVRECHGAAGPPASATCTTTTRNLSRPVIVVTQCNGSINGGGGTLRCSVRVTNNFVGMSPGATGVTVNQCVGSGDGLTTGCVPFPATTTGATITQCNGSANGGTLVELTCTATGTQSSRQPLRIHQCNGSGNGGGGLVICSASVTNRRIAAPSSGSTPAATPPATDTGQAAMPSGTSGPVLIGILLVVTLWLAMAFSRFGKRR